ncbi:hypothetical protein [Mangrovimonas aestuarii]|uniref:hypothetical protein n=1 Tax=Mangrovimonas aestuarii TaxID=3018443 RepID=UPI002379415B|nr:hypothetical protein [Mangrovimonas aestuarii]
MHQIQKAISFVFHPIIMPLVGVVFYFSKSPRYLPFPIIQSKVISVFLLTFLLPVLLYFLLKTIGKAESIYLKRTKERVLPLLLNCAIILLILRRVLPPNEIIELYYFFVGILLSSLACLVLAMFNFKASIHMIAVSGILMFFMALSIHFSININGSLALIFIICGAVASSRLHLNAHTVKELVVGFLVGFLPQLIMINYWL